MESGGGILVPPKELLFAATLRDDVAGVFGAIEAGADVDSVNDFGFTALHYAAKNGATNIEKRRGGVGWLC